MRPTGAHFMARVVVDFYKIQMGQRSKQVREESILQILRPVAGKLHVGWEVAAQSAKVLAARGDEVKTKEMTKAI